MKAVRNILLAILALILLSFFIRPYATSPKPLPVPGAVSSKAETGQPDLIPAALLDSFRGEIAARFPGRASLADDSGFIAVRLSVTPGEFSEYMAAFQDGGDVSSWYAFTDDLCSMLRDWQQRLAAAGAPGAVITSTVYRSENDDTNTVLARFIGDRCDYDYFDHLAAGAPAPDSGTSLGEQNALRSAQSYLRVSGFSKTGLLDQLQFEGYTYEEARYAVNACGADWNEQAYRSAQSYLSVSDFSRDRLISQLEYEGFTHDEALYGVTKAGY